MSQKSKERHRQRRAAERAADQSLHDRRLEERAVREGWIDGELRATIVRRLLRTLDSDIAEDRAVNAAARTLVYADLGDRRLALAQQIHADRLYTAARASAGTDASSAEPIDPAIHDWYATSCPCALPPGECKIHPRARASQRPPPGDWRVWAYIAGRGSGKTRAGAEWIQHRVETGEMRLGALIAPTANEIRDVLVGGPSGILAIASPQWRPTYSASTRRLTWPNGAWAVCLSGEEPERARGKNVDTIWADELGAWQRAQGVWDNAMLALAPARTRRR